MLLRKLFRTAWKYKTQFISMIIMIAIGVGVFVGFNMEWISLDKNINKYFEAPALSGTLTDIVLIPLIVVVPLTVPILQPEYLSRPCDQGQGLSVGG